MTKIKPQEVGSIIRWHDGAAIGRNYDHCDMHVKYLILVASWKSFKKGIASPYQQQLCYEIHKCLMKGLAGGDKVPFMMEGARVHSLVQPDERVTNRRPMKITEAINRIAQMDGKSPDSVRKQWNKWCNASDIEREEVLDKFMSSKKADFT